MHLYSHIFHPLRVFEKQNEYAYLTERHLQVIWFEQKHLSSLYTHEGQIIEIISPGIWNREAGPDFLKAHLRIGMKKYKGDVELHLNHEGWYHHGHHHDPRYNQVVLHLSYTPSFRSRPIIKQNGEVILSLALNNSLKFPLEQLLQSIDLELYPYKKLTQAGNCAHRLFKSMPEEKIELFFQSAALWRLEKKSDYLKIRASTKSLQFLLGLSMTLGYKYNAEPFSDLFELLFTYRDLSEQELLAIAMGCCGFFDNQQNEKWKTSAFYQHLNDLWYEKQAEMILQVNLRLDRIRPLNHPLRRLAYLIKLVKSSICEQLWDKLLNLWKLNYQWMRSEKHAFHLQRVMMQLLPIYEDSYWNTHFTFEKQIQKKKLCLMGEDLKREILINVFMPLLYSSLMEDPIVNEMQKFSQFYHSFKSSNTSKTRYLNERFFAGLSKNALLKSAQIEQGAYQLHQDFCIHFESSCEGCPFIERMQMQN